MEDRERVHAKNHAKKYRLPTSVACRFKLSKFPTDQMNIRVEEDYELLAVGGSSKGNEIDKDVFYSPASRNVRRLPFLLKRVISTRKLGDLVHLLPGTLGIFQVGLNPTLKSRLVPCRVPLNRRRSCVASLLFGLTLLATLLLLVFCYGGAPPYYADFRVKERALPQHRWGLWTAGKGSNALFNQARSRDWRSQQGSRANREERYLRFPDHLWGHGLNNVLQEALLYGLLAHASNRSYVFEDFTWSHIPLPYTIYDFSLRPTRIPMSAFLGGWLVGQRLENDLAGDKQPVVIARELSLHEQTSQSPNTLINQEYDVDTRGHGHGNEANEDLNSRMGSHYDGRSISAEYFDHVCLPSERAEIVFPSIQAQNANRWLHKSAPDYYGVNIHFASQSISKSSYATQDAPNGMADGIDILRWWMDRLDKEDVRDERCVVIRERERRVWDPEFFGSVRPLSLFPILQTSPVLRKFQWSSLVRNAVDRTVERFFPSSLKGNTRPPFEPIDAHFASGVPKTNITNNTTAVIPGLLAVHLRRGDYKRHCLRLAHWGAGYMGWNRLLEGRDGEASFEDGLYAFMDGERPPLAGKEGVRSDAEDGITPVLDVTQEEWEIERERRREVYYLAHCLPTVHQIVTRLREVREQYTRMTSKTLKEVYVLTNGWPSFVDELRRVLLADGWNKVVTSVDVERGSLLDNHSQDSEGERPGTVITNLRMQAFEVMGGRMPPSISGLNKEEKGVSAAIDMGLAERAEAFVGNGFSSLSANIVLFRLAKGFPTKSNWML